MALQPKLSVVGEVALRVSEKKNGACYGHYFLSVHRCIRGGLGKWSPFFHTTSRFFSTAL